MRPMNSDGALSAILLKSKLIADLCQRYGVLRLELFGSIATELFDQARSDIDFLVTFPDDYDYGPWLARLQDFEKELAGVVGGRVDVVLSSVLRKPRFRAEAYKTRRVIFNASKIADVA